MDELTPYRRSRWKKLRSRLPGTTTTIGLPGPAVTLSDSARERELEAVRILCIGLSRRAIFFASGELERPGEAVRSAEAVVEEVEAARHALPPGSDLDQTLEVLQDACNTLRLDLRAKENDWWPFGEALYEFRALAFQWAERIADATGLNEARRVAAKIDLSNARDPNGEPTATVNVPPPRRNIGGVAPSATERQD